MGLEDWVGGGVGAGLEAPVSTRFAEVGGLSGCALQRQPRNLICLWMHMGAGMSVFHPRDT